MVCPASGAQDLLTSHRGLAGKEQRRLLTLPHLLPTPPLEGPGRQHSLSVGHVSGRRHCCVVEVLVFIHPDLSCPAGVPANKVRLPELQLPSWPQSYLAMLV